MLPGFQQSGFHGKRFLRGSWHQGSTHCCCCFSWVPLTPTLRVYPTDDHLLRGHWIWILRFRDSPSASKLHITQFIWDLHQKDFTVLGSLTKYCTDEKRTFFDVSDAYLLSFHGHQAVWRKVTMWSVEPLKNCVRIHRTRVLVCLSSELSTGQEANASLVFFHGRFSSLVLENAYVRDMDTRCSWEFCVPTSALSNALLISSIRAIFGTLSVKMARWSISCIFVDYSWKYHSLQSLAFRQNTS